MSTEVLHVSSVEVLRIPMSDRRPVEIVIDQWPVLSSLVEQMNDDSGVSWSVYVRQHALVGSDPSSWGDRTPRYLVHGLWEKVTLREHQTRIGGYLVEGDEALIKAVYAVLSELKLDAGFAPRIFALLPAEKIS